MDRSAVLHVMEDIYANPRGPCAVPPGLSVGCWALLFDSVSAGLHRLERMGSPAAIVRRLWEQVPPAQRIAVLTTKLPATTIFQPSDAMKSTARIAGMSALLLEWAQLIMGSPSALHVPALKRALYRHARHGSIDDIVALVSSPITARLDFRLSIIAGAAENHVRATMRRRVVQLFPWAAPFARSRFPVAELAAIPFVSVLSLGSSPEEINRNTLLYGRRAYDYMLDSTKSTDPRMRDLLKETLVLFLHGPWSAPGNARIIFDTLFPSLPDIRSVSATVSAAAKNVRSADGFPLWRPKTFSPKGARIAEIRRCPGSSAFLGRVAAECIGNARIRQDSDAGFLLACAGLAPVGLRGELELALARSCPHLAILRHRPLFCWMKGFHKYARMVLRILVIFGMALRRARIRIQRRRLVPELKMLPTRPWAGFPGGATTRATARNFPRAPVRPAPLPDQLLIVSLAPPTAAQMPPGTSMLDVEWGIKVLPHVDVLVPEGDNLHETAPEQFEFDLALPASRPRFTPARRRVEWRDMDCGLWLLFPECGRVFAVTAERVQAALRHAAEHCIMTACSVPRALLGAEAEFWDLWHTTVRAAFARGRPARAECISAEPQVLVHDFSHVIHPYSDLPDWLVRSDLIILGRDWSAGLWERIPRGPFPVRVVFALRRGAELPHVRSIACMAHIYDWTVCHAFF